MPFKIHGTRAPERKAAKSLRNPKIDAFQELKDKSPRTKGSKKAKKSPNWCLLRIEGQALGRKAAKSPRNSKIDVFQELKDRSAGTKGSKKAKKSIISCLWKNRPNKNSSAKLLRICYTLIIETTRSQLDKQPYWTWKFHRASSRQAGSLCQHYY